MRLYNTLQRTEKKIKSCLRTGYYLAFETKEVNRKRALYKDVHWSDEEKKNFDSYWMNLLNKRISDKWHKLYQSFNGIYCKEYIPEILYTTYIEPRLNDPLYSSVFGNKGITELILHSELVLFPETICYSDGKNFYDSKRRVISENNFWSLICNAGEIVIKPAASFGSGTGIMFLNMKDGIDLNTMKTYRDINTMMLSREVLVQRLFKQHEAIAAINPSSVNTIRITTYIVKGEVHYSPIVLRCGSGGSHVDNIHSGGLCVAVEDDGSLGNTAYKIGYSDICERYNFHPVTKTEFCKVKIPYIKRIIDAACSLHGRSPHIGIIGWDFSISSDGTPVVIEQNFHGDSIWFPQIVHGKSFFRDDSKAIMECVGLRKQKK